MFRHLLHRATRPCMRCNRANDDEPSRLTGQHIRSTAWTGEKALLGGQGDTVPDRFRDHNRYANLLLPIRISQSGRRSKSRERLADSGANWSMVGYPKG